MHKSIVLCLVLLLPVFVSAHVSVKPNEVVVGAYQTFNVSVPTEKDMATIGVSLIIPEGLESVRPNVKPGWNVQIVKEGEGEDATVKELIWTGGSIPADQRDDFFFSAKTPGGETTLEWKAYQTYADGSVVSWDATGEEQPKDADGEDDFSVRGPFSQTKVINDLKKEENDAAVVASLDNDAKPQGVRMDCWTMIALIMSGVALILGIRNTIPKKRLTDVV